MAGYSTSSTMGDRRWISSMNSTSWGSRLVSKAARSPGRSRIGPEVLLIDTPISWAMILARVVLPSPGGPKISVWSRDSLRPRAAWMNKAICSRTTGWPMYSARRNGRIARSWTSSRSRPVAAISRSASIT
ncbi:hypothetical protein D3C80_1759910 [compost metagenome]